MAKRKEGVHERILACAREEFLRHGFMDASLRTIAEKAETSTNSIYVRFGDKEGLFCAIAAPARDGFLEQFTKLQDTFHYFEQEDQKKNVKTYSSNGMIQLLDYMYAHFTDFEILLNASYGTKYANFIDELVRLEVEYTYRFFEAIGFAADGMVSKELVHIVSTSYFEGFFEVVRHHMSYEEAREYTQALTRFHHAGFAAIFPFEK